MRYITRQTFIALRARRLGHQIAREILNPPISVPPPEAPSLRAPPAYDSQVTRVNRADTSDAMAEWTEMSSEEKWAQLVLLFAGIIFVVVAAVNTYLNWDWL